MLLIAVHAEQSGAIVGADDADDEDEGTGGAEDDDPVFLGGQQQSGLPSPSTSDGTSYGTGNGSIPRPMRLRIEANHDGR